MLTTRGPAHRRSSGLRGRAARAALALGTTLLVPAIAAGALAPTASAATTLIQKPGTAGCIAKSGFGGCTVGRGVGSVQSVALSPDGANAYAASDYGDSLAVFDRAADGTLSQKAGLAGCFSTDSATEPCTPAAALDGARKVALSPDGKSVYVAGGFSDAIAVFDRAADGTLVQKPGTAGCISDAGAGSCTSGHDLDLAGDVLVSPDGATVYAGTLGGKLLVFDRAADGALTQRAGLAGCVAEVPSATCSDGRALEGPTHIALSPDGRSLYVSAQLSNAVALFDVAADGTPAQKPGSAGCISADGSGGACGFAKALRSASSVTLSPSGADVYVTAAGSDGVAVFGRAGDGTLTQKPGTAGCVSSMPSNGACGNAIMLDGPTAIAVSPDGANAYVTTRPLINLLSLDGAVVVFDRAADGSLTQKAAPAGCVYSDPDARCVTARALNSPSAVTVSPDSASAYVASPMASAVSVFDTNRPAPPPPPPPAAPAPTRSSRCCAASRCVPPASGGVAWRDDRGARRDEDRLSALGARDGALRRPARRRGPALGWALRRASPVQSIGQALRSLPRAPGRLRGRGRDVLDPRRRRREHAALQRPAGQSPARGGALPAARRCERRRPQQLGGQGRPLRDPAPLT